MTSPTTSTSSISGLVSNMDTTTIISQLMQIESRPQTLLKTQLTTSQNQAAAYRDINSLFASLSTAADALTQSSSWNLTKASSSSGSVAATATAGAQAGTVSFSVDALASGHALISDAAQKWGTATTAFGLGTLTLTKSDGSPYTKSDGTVVGPITPTDVDGDGTISLSDAVAAINAAGVGITASAVNAGNGFQLSLSSTATGLASGFQLATSSGTVGFTVLNQAADAKITLGAGGPTPTAITSPTNTFSGVLSGTSFTVSQAATTATVTVTSDPDAVAGKVAAVVAAANAVLNKIKANTDSSTGSTAPLKGDYSLNQLAGQVLDAVSSMVGTSVLDASNNPISSSAGSNGLQLTKDGTLTFDAAAFKTAFAANPALVQAVFSGAYAAGTDGTLNTPDDTITTQGVGARLKTLATMASDKATGMLTSLANGQDTRAKDIQSQIDDWTTRLALRQQTLTDQFTAMETALGTLKNQSSWLTSQIASLPTWSSSSK
ncbi:MAG: fliD [Blastococcus sp.]|jgi:flagellar hook-associated protein 2|nr:fliD [Blastococcus sp.]